MLELLMTGGKGNGGGSPIVPDIALLWDFGQGKDLNGTSATIAVSGGSVVDTTNTIDGNPTLSFPNTSASATITFQTPLDFSGKDFTIEWSSYNTAAASAYANELCLYSGAGSTGILSRWGDSGFGNRLQFGNSFSAAATCWNMNFTKAQSVNVLCYYAIVCKDGFISIYRNGIKQALANGTGASYTAQGYTAQASFGDLRAVRIGFLSSSVPAMTGRHGRIRISKNALYTANYTPVPF